MVEWELDYDNQILLRLTHPAKQISNAIDKQRGVRIGQSTVISQKMHTYHPEQVEEIQIVQDADAGQTFYHRTDQGKIFHLDIFHETGLVDHRQVAAAVKQAVELYNLHYSMQHILIFSNREQGVNPHHIDIQTGTGGGRVTGDLNRGTKLSLKKAHENHVHVAALIPREHIACLFYLVNSIEKTILSTSLELRRNERIVHIRSGGGKSDMSPYADHQSDSFLQEKNCNNMSPIVKEHQLLQDTEELTEQFDSPRDLQKVFDDIDQGMKHSKLLKELNDRGNGSDTLERMIGMGVVEANRSQIKLTEYGQALKEYLKINMTDIDAYIRRSIRLIKPASEVSGKSLTLLKKSGSSGTGSSRTENWLSGNIAGELAIAETVHAAAGRSILENNDFRITCRDIQQQLRYRRNKTDFCLLVDASASMAGMRIKAAKFLARHLFLASNDRISVVTFQEDKAIIQVPLTRNYQLAEECLSRINSIGSTPLALGLNQTLSYLQEARAVNPLIVLITDGVPTLPDKTRDPLADALTAAAKIKDSGYAFTCIGLKPHRGYLEELSKAAGGRAYILEELEKQALVKATWAERRINGK